MRVTIVLPSLNPDDKLLQVVDALVERGFHRILLVNDGSDQEHLAPFEQAARHPQCVLLRHAKNLGKGRALTRSMEEICDQLADRLQGDTNNLLTLTLAFPGEGPPQTP